MQLLRQLGLLTLEHALLMLPMTTATKNVSVLEAVLRQNLFMMDSC
jgi:hypothetical protein